MVNIIDQLNRKVQLQAPAQRIVSIVPSQTELLFHLGLNEEVIGITRFCIHPKEWHSTKKRIGGTKTVNIDAVKALQPDLIIANKEENTKSQIEELEKIAPVWISDINRLEQSLDMIEQIGILTGKESEAKAIAQQISERFNSFTPSSVQFRVCYLIWRNPYMTIGGDTFISNLLSKCGFVNVFANHNRYPEINIEKMIAARPGIVFLSSEPYPFKEKHIEEIKRYMPEVQVMLVDGEMFSWYGSRLLNAPTYFEELIREINCISEMK
ncbi:helical backbone metal receptor [Danxiaibacter flavus]|uniref:Helical backbone metal receptor n=1 Tax=Danxiaibacter flavus TaxID=3049108 RepID=A0ABV3ZDR4_9BACT|nr:helical backbone metal receptor [Chitinophagaceae bacterium DXS]